ncbi:MAG TPA: glycoside hydrolase family 38 C-terminal domain-containing protein [Streptosporangiaceae bacterium]
MRISDIESTDLFGGTAARPLQIVRVTLTGTGSSPHRDRDARVTVRVEGPGVSTPVPATIDLPGPGAQCTAEAGVEIAAPVRPGSVRSVTVIAEALESRAEAGAEITVAEPGWTMWMVSHFHYDPVWWDTQGQFTESRLILPDERGNLPAARTAFELVRLHLETARQDPDYKFVLAEIDYLKPHFDAHPEDRADLRRFIAEGRIEIVGGNYNEPNTNLTSAESTIRNAVYGIGYQRDVLGGDPRTAWMLDAFGFDPGYPGLMAAAGLTTSAWARGPFHQWGPNRTVGDNRRMQFPSEFEWISPDGGGLVTSYMANHYGAGWVTHHAPDVRSAEKAAYEQFRELAPVAATPNVLLPVGSDHVIPSRWATGIHRDWNERYVWPRFVMALPSEFFAAVRHDAAGANAWMTPQTRDMNPVYTGKDVSYIDTKQAQRAGETAVTNAERLATLAWLAPPVSGAPGYRYPAESLDKAWRQLVFGAHHDAITGTESDQVYLDLLGGWREAWQRGHQAGQRAASHLAGLIGTEVAGHGAVVVFNTLARVRTAMATVTLSLPRGMAPWITLAGPSGSPVPCLAEGIARHDDGSLAGLTLTFCATGLPPLGYRSYPIVPAGQEPHYPGWQVVPGATVIENDALAVAVDPARGGAVSRVWDKRQGVPLLREGAVGNELVLQEEYAYHPKWNEGQWLLSPTGASRGLAGRLAGVRAERCAVGSRLVTEFTDGDLRITQETLLWDSADRVEFRTHVDGSIGQDRLLRVRFPADVPGGLPIYQTATAVIGRPPGAADTDVAGHWFTLDNPAYQWLGVGSTARVALQAADGGRLMQAVGVAEVIPPFMSFEKKNGAPLARTIDAGLDPMEAAEDADVPAVRAAVRELMAALAGQGVTATCSRPDGPRYGAIDVDSNLPDFRIALGDGDQNPFTAEVLAAADPACEKELQEQLQQTGSARLWVPATRTREDVFAPGTDARGPRDLPVLIVAGRGLGGLAPAIGQVTGELAAHSVIEAAGNAGPGCAPLAERSVALLNRGTPSGLVTPDGTVYISLMRSCSAWPSGVWIDGERRTAPDGSSFNWQHWTHTFEYALAAGPGDWRTASFNAAGEDYNQDVVTCQTGAHDGPLPSEASLCSVDPPEVTLTAVKPRGNPLASGRPGAPDPTGGVVFRLRETTGRPAQARVSLPGSGGARRTDLLEQAEGDPLPTADSAAIVDISPAGLASVIMERPPAADNAQPSAALPSPEPHAAVLASPEPHPTAPAAPDDGTELAQPVYTRYWLHGKGPAPTGNLPVAVHISPGRCAIAAAGAAVPVGAALDSEATLRVTVGCGVEPAAGRVELDVPPGLEAAHEQPLDFDLPAGEHAWWDVTVRAAPGASTGRYFVAVRIRESLGQVTEDAALVAVGEPPSPDLNLPLDELLPLIEADQRAGAGEIEVTLLSEDITLAPGQRGEMSVRIGNRLASQLRGEAQLISPFGSWQALGPWTQGFAAGPGEDITVSYPVTMPLTARPGAHWWAIVKVMYFGRVHYTQAVPVAVSS